MYVKTGGKKVFDVLGSGDERQVVTGSVKPVGEIGPDCSGADYGDPHWRMPCRIARASACAGNASAYMESLYHMAL
jgi:hypothetical protein